MAQQSIILPQEGSCRRKLVKPRTPCSGKYSHGRCELSDQHCISYSNFRARTRLKHRSGCGDYQLLERTSVGTIKHVLSMSPLSISSLISFGDRPSTWHPTLNAVPSISLTVPLNSFAKDFCASRIILAIEMISSKGIDLECFIFFSFLRSRGGSLRARMTNDDADGTTDTAAWRF